MLSQFGPDRVEGAVFAGRRRIGQIVATSKTTGKVLPPRPALHQCDLAWVQEHCIERLWQAALAGARHDLGILEDVDWRTGRADGWHQLDSVRCPRLRMQLAASAVLLVVRLARGSLPCRVQCDGMTGSEVELGISGVLGHAFWFVDYSAPVTATALPLVHRREWREPKKSKAEHLEARWRALEDASNDEEFELSGDDADHYSLSY
jgi:hypothetical protein